SVVPVLVFILHSSFYSPRPTPTSTLFPYTTLFRSCNVQEGLHGAYKDDDQGEDDVGAEWVADWEREGRNSDENVGDCGQCEAGKDRKSTRLNSSHVSISYAVFCLKKKKQA